MCLVSGVIDDVGAMCVEQVSVGFKVVKLDCYVRNAANPLLLGW